MAVVIPQVVTEDRASGAQVIDGSLRFNADNSTHLKRTFSSAGNRKKWTWSAWLKKTKLATQEMIFQANNGGSLTSFYINAADVALFLVGGGSIVFQTSRVFRDTSNFMHLVIAVDTSQSSAFDRIKFYVNGEKLPSDQYATAPAPGLNTEYEFNNSCDHYFSGTTYGHMNYYMTNAYFIDGQQLDASYFGFTDPLTNTWRPKKFSGSFSNSNPNDGTVWSDSTDAALDNFDGKEAIFDGSLSTRGGDTNTAYLTYVNNASITCTNGIRVYYNGIGAGQRYIRINGTTELDDGSGALAPGWSSISSFSGTINKIEIKTANTGSFAVSAIEIDGTILIDGANYSGVNSFYLPTDGNTPVGNDESGRGNDFTPVNLTGSVGLDKATGALPILNTNGGGTVANVGVRTDAYASSLKVALPLVGNANDVSDLVNSTNTAKTVTVSGAVASSAQSNFYNGSFLFDGSNDSLSMAASADFEFTGDHTLEFWMYLNSLGGSVVPYATGGAGSADQVYIDSTGIIIWAYGQTGANQSAAGVITTGRWQHIAISRSGTNLRTFVDGVIVASSTNSSSTIGSSSATAYIGRRNDGSYVNGYIQDFRIYKGVAKYTSNFLVGSTSPDILPDTPSGVATKTKLTKINEGAVSFNGSDQYLSVDDNADFTVGSDPFTIEFYAYKTESGEDYFCGSSNSGGSTASMSYSVQTGGGSPSNSLRAHVGDGSSLTTVNSGVDFPTNRWVHVAFVRDGNTLRLFQDGIQMDTTSFSGTVKDSADPFMIGRGFAANSSKNFPGFISNFRFIKGTALYTSDFTPPTEPLTNVTNTKLLCCHDPLSAVGSIVTPGSITAAGGAQATNFNPFNTDVNTIRGQETVYCTWNPLNKGSVTLSNGNLDAVTSTTWQLVRGTMGISSGKCYWEYTMTAAGYTMLGMNVADPMLNIYAGYEGYAYYSVNGYSYNNNTGASYGNTFTTGDVIGVAFDADSGKIWFAKNGKWQGGGHPESDTNAAYSSIPAGTYFPTTSQDNSGGATGGSANFGQKPFKFTPPDGYQTLSGSSIRPEKVIPNPSQYVGVVTYIGNDNTQTITGLNFKADLLWLKSAAQATNHELVDSVRGSNKIIFSNLTNVETTDADRVTSINSNGFSMGPNSNANVSGLAVGWCWKAGGSKNTFNIDDVGYASAAAAGLDGGTITPSGASIGTKQGFSIIAYTGDNASTATISHGLLQAPQFIIIKNRTTSGYWVAGHSSIDWDKGLYLNTTDAQVTASYFGSSPSITSSTFSIGTASGLANSNGDDFIAYLWCNVPGLQKFGKYTGNGSSDGPFVELGFRPSLLIIKDTGGNDWYIFDNERSNSKPLFPNGNYAEQPDNRTIDFLSNGFKIRYNQFFNGSSANMIYAAWAEAPSFNMYGASSNARATK